LHLEYNRVIFAVMASVEVISPAQFLAEAMDRENNRPVELKVSRYGSDNCSAMKVVTLAFEGLKQ
jgi:hypothetical protein